MKEDLKSLLYVLLIGVLIMDYNKLKWTRANV